MLRVPVEPFRVKRLCATKKQRPGASAENALGEKPQRRFRLLVARHAASRLVLGLYWLTLPGHAAGIIVPA
jgi:hypothetical protein